MSATKFNVGTVKKGLEPNSTWIVKADKNGRHSWRRRKVRGRKFVTLDNGARPFEVRVDGPTVTVLKLDTMDPSLPGRTIKVYRSVEKTMVGLYGSSVLLKLRSGKMVYVGHNLTEFRPVRGDEIIRFYSPFARSQAPYPVALGRKNVYFMLDRVHVARSRFSPKVKWNDAYGDFYGHVNEKWYHAHNGRKKWDGMEKAGWTHPFDHAKVIVPGRF